MSTNERIKEALRLIGGLPRDQRINAAIWMIGCVQAELGAPFAGYRAEFPNGATASIAVGIGPMAAAVDGFAAGVAARHRGPVSATANEDINDVLPGGGKAGPVQ